MAKQRLTELPLASSISQNDLVYVVQSTTSRASNIATVFASATTGNIREHGSNLYFTNARARQAITVTGGASYDAGSGVINVNNLGVEYVANINGANGQVILTTANIAEKGNLYFTNSRVVSALIQGDYIIIEANGRISSTSPGTITANDLTTSNVVELNNLYYTNTRVFSNVQPILQLKANIADLQNITSNVITANSFISAGSGVPTIQSGTNINLAANAAVVITQSVLRLASFTDGQVANLTAMAGDIVYNSTNNKFQGYTTSGWKDLH